MTRVSVVIPVYNGERYIEAAVRSVLDQTYTDVECVVVDDGSTDSTAAVLDSIDDPRLRVVRQPNAGVSQARNRGMLDASGDLIAFLDADDVWLPEKLERQVALFRDQPHLGLAVSGYSVTDEVLVPRRTVFPDRRQFDLRRLLMLEAPGIGLSFTGVVRRDVGASVGFDPTYSTSADLDFALRVRDRHEMDAVLEPLVLYRTHAAQMHLDLDAFELDMLRLFDEWLRPGSHLARYRRRAVANLYTRLFFYEASRRQWPAAWPHLARAARARPDRIVMLPLWAAWTRARAKILLRRLGR